MSARKQASEHTLYLIDISSLIFRAFYAIRHLSNRLGEPTNAVYGVATMLARLIDDARPENLVVAYDSKEPSNRKKVYEEYKANRAETPEELIPQFDRIEQLISAMKIHSYRQSGIEADDLIGTLSKRWCKLSPKNLVVIVSGDKDLMQLVNERVEMLDTLKNVLYDSAGVEEKMGVRPDQIRDYLGLVGDSSDNIPGVTGIGPKGAQELLKSYETLDGVLDAAASGKISGKKGQIIHEQREVARLSAGLATVHTELDLSLDPAFVKYQFEVTPELSEFLKLMDFHALLERWNGVKPGSGARHGSAAKEAVLPDTVAADEPVNVSTTAAMAYAPAPVQEFSFKMINTEEGFRKILLQIEKSKEFGFDLETTSLNPREAELVGVALCVDRDTGYYIPVGHRGTQVEQLSPERVIAGLKPYLENPDYKKIGQNLKYDWSVISQMGVKPQGIGADTMVAAYVLEADGRHDLKTLAAQYLAYDVLSYEEVCGKGKNQIGFDLVAVDVATRYSAEDALIAVRLWDALKPKLESESLMDVFYQVDLPLVPVLSRMESNGVCIDESWLRALSVEFGRGLREIEVQVAAFTKGPVNLNSPKQLAQLLFEELKLPVQSKTKTGYSTDASVLEALSPLHEVPRLLLEYREISKLKGTYVDPLPLLRDSKTGKIHASFHQAVTATGRLSSSDPNLQNIPIKTERGRKIRGGFIPSPGNVLVSADYSQIELRLLAHMSGDKELVGSFLKDEDVHRRTAAEIFGIAPEAVDDRGRGIAKAINFGLMYGKTPFGLALELKISRKEAHDIIDRYFQRYEGVKRFLDSQIEQAREKGFVTTAAGRKRRLPDINSKNPTMRGFAERMAMNTPIQGTAADLMKLAMIELDRRLEQGGYRSKLIIQVHDEVVLDCPVDEAEKVEKLVCEVMEGAMQLSVPLRVNSGRGKNWMEL